MATLGSSDRRLTYRSGWILVFIGRIIFHKLQQAVWAVVLLLLAALSGYVTYRHGTLLDRLPVIRWRPVTLAVPLSEHALLGEPVRWVEMETMAAPKSSPQQILYRNTVESPGALLLHFPYDPGDPGRQKYRGVLQTYRTRRTGYRFPESIARALPENDIAPNQKFAILSVNASPWPYYAPRIIEWFVVVSGLTLVLFFLIHGARALLALGMPISRRQWIEQAHHDHRGAWPPCCARCGQVTKPEATEVTVNRNELLPLCQKCSRDKERWAAKLRLVATGIATLAAAWLLYRSLRYRPVLPIESILALGLSALLGLIITFRSRQPWRRYLLLISQKPAGARRQIKSILVHKAFLAALIERSHS